MRIMNFKPTQFVILDSAKKALKTMHDDEILPLAIETIARNRTVNTPSKNLTTWQKVKQFFQTKSSLKVMLGKEKDGAFYLKTSRKINDLRFDGNNVPVDMYAIAKKPSLVDSYILKSKEGILGQIEGFNNNKKLFRL